MSNMIVVAEGNEVGEWSLEWDAAAWEAMTVRERTDIICGMYLTEMIKRVQREEEADHLHYLSRFITDDRLRRLVFEAWQMVPKLEQGILRALFPQIRNGYVEDGLACTMPRTDDAKPNPRFSFEITVDLDKVGHESDDEVVNSILHEFVHVAYRHPIIQYWFEQVPTGKLEKVREVFTQLTETQALIQARAWQDAAASGDSAVS